MSTTTVDISTTSAPSAPAIGWNSNPATKRKYVARAKAHKLADEIVKGQYWENDKGCLIGCLSHQSSGGHGLLAGKFGAPVSMMYLCDRLFERLPNARAKEFPLQVVQAIEVGTNLNAVWDKFLLTLLADEKMGALSLASDNAKPAIQGVIDLCQRQVAGDFPQRADWREARRKTYADAVAVAYADAVAYAYADADAVAYAVAVAYARKQRQKNHYVWQADLLISLLKSAKK